MERKASSNTACRTLCQYSKEPVSGADMRKLLEIAGDYRKVKDYVYQRYGGISALFKLYPGYTVQNEMTESGLRSELGLPSVYFYLAVFDALGDIKTQWTNTKSKIAKQIVKNQNFTEKEKHYLRFVVKTAGAFEAVLNRQGIKLSGSMGKQYEWLAGQVDEKKLQNYLCRQVRKCKVKFHASQSDGFSISGKAYRYGEQEGKPGIYMAIKEKRKRVFIPLTDRNQYESQIYVKLYPEEGRLKLYVPVRVAIRKHRDYINQVGAAMGMDIMLTTDQGHEYGALLGKYHREYADWVRQQMGSYQRNRENNPGRKKHERKKNRYEARLHGYINQELNTFLREEKPQILYLPKLPGVHKAGISKAANNAAALWQRGYIRGRLAQKCREQSIAFKEVFAKNISIECSQCGEAGEKNEGIFTCSFCGFQAEERLNTAKNVKKRGALID